MGITSDPQIPAKQAVCEMKALEELYKCYLVLIGVHLGPKKNPPKSSLACKSAETVFAQCNAF